MWTHKQSNYFMMVKSFFYPNILKRNHFGPMLYYFGKRVKGFLRYWGIKEVDDQLVLLKTNQTRYCCWTFTLTCRISTVITKSFRCFVIPNLLSNPNEPISVWKKNTILKKVVYRCLESSVTCLKLMIC